MVELSILLRNEAGELAKVTEILGAAHINIVAISVADLGEYSIVRIICDKPEEALARLQGENYYVNKRIILGLKVDNMPGEMAKIAKILGQNNINIDYLYQTLSSKGQGKAAILSKVEDVERAREILLKENFQVLKDASEI